MNLREYCIQYAACVFMCVDTFSSYPWGHVWKLWVPRKIRLWWWFSLWNSSSWRRVRQWCTCCTRSGSGNGHGTGLKSSWIHPTQTPELVISHASDSKGYTRHYYTTIIMILYYYIYIRLIYTISIIIVIIILIYWNIMIIHHTLYIYIYPLVI